ncbi:MAG: FAD-dependent oxidoreductase [Bacteroidales bacterium]|nr:FAD-dependent oxidoreductase [Bacteroidales bacterium]
MGNQQHIAIIGGGIAGMETASTLAAQHYKVTIIEKEDTTGGKLNNWHHLFPDFSDPAEIIAESKAKSTENHVDIIYNTEITHIEKKDNRFVLSDNKNITIYSDAVVLAGGFSLFDATLKEEYGYGLFDNVITSADFEKQLKTKKKFTTAQGLPPKRVGIIHCVGSRDAKTGNTYCSKVCCITGIKQAIEINEMIPDCEIYCFYMDLRLYGSTFDSLYLRAQQEHKIQFVRGRLSEVSEKQDKHLQIKAEDTLSGKPLRMNVDMIILLIGMEPTAIKEQLVEHNTIQLDDNGFFKSANIHNQRNSTIQEGVFMAGTCICPMSINEVIENARSCALSVINYLRNNAL